MRKSLASLLLILLFPVTLMSQIERIYTHHSDIVVDTSGVIRVSEKIRIYANGDIFKRGITRSLPTTRIDADGKEIKINYNIIEILKNGNAEPFFTEKDGGYTVIYIGNRDMLLSPGYYDYVITYESVGQIGFYEEYDELGWNVNGESERTIDLVSCEIRLPENAQILSHRCYSGTIGSTNSNCNSESFSDGIFKASSANLKPNEMLTVYVGFEKGIVNEPVIKESLWSKILLLLDRIGLWVLNLIIIVPLFFYYFKTWQKHGVDPERPVIIPQFEPPHNLSPASVGMIYDEVFNQGLVTTSIINLAIKGYIKIEEIERKGIMKLGGKKYKLLKLKDNSSDLPAEESIIMTSLFSESQVVSLSGEYNSNVESMMLKYQKNLKKQHSALTNEGQNIKFRIISWCVVLLYIFLLFLLGRNEPMELYVVLFSIIFPTFIIIAFVYVIYSAIRKRKPKKIISISLSLAIILGVIGVFIYFPFNRISSTSIAFLIGMPLVLIGHMLFSYLIIRPSEKKLELQSEIEGLKMYISLAEENQMQYFNSPEVTPEVFEKLLPYAIALKVDKIWGEKFEKTLLKSLQTNNVAYVPLWFVGNTIRPVNIGNNLRQSLTSGIQQSSVNPQSTSGNNWGSGSFGGGSVGGGGGGGRTGGW